MCAPLPCVLSLLSPLLLQKFNKESLEFQQKLLERSGLGNETYLPAGVHVLCRAQP